MTHVRMKSALDLLAQCPISSTLARPWLRSVGRRHAEGASPWLMMLAVGLRKVCCDLSICNYQPASCHAGDQGCRHERGHPLGRKRSLHRYLRKEPAPRVYTRPAGFFRLSASMAVRLGWLSGPVQSERKYPVESLASRRRRPNGSTPSAVS